MCWSGAMSFASTVGCHILPSRRVVDCKFTLVIAVLLLGCDSLAGDTSVANGSQRPTSPPLITPVTPLYIFLPSQRTGNGLSDYSAIQSFVWHFTNDALFYPGCCIHFLTSYIDILGLPYCLFLLWQTVIEIFCLYLDMYFVKVIHHSPLYGAKNTIFGNFLLKIIFFKPSQNNRNRSINRHT